MSLEFSHISDLVDKTAIELISPPEGTPLLWWFKFNELIGGLRAHELTLLCAPTGAGKTQLLSNIGAQLLIQNVPTFVAPVETGDTDFLIRVLSCFEQRDYNTGVSHSAESIGNLFVKYEKILERPFYIASYDNRVCIEDMTTMLKYQYQENGIKVAVLDNLNFFLRVVSANEERTEMDTAIHEFVMLAKKIPIHIILVVHPKKTEGGRVESEFDVKGSSTAVQECANMFALNRPNKDDIESGIRKLSDREIVFYKIRKRGMNVRKPIYLSFDGGRYQEYQK